MYWRLEFVSLASTTLDSRYLALPSYLAHQKVLSNVMIPCRFTIYCRHTYSFHFIYSSPDLYQENAGYKHLTWKYFIAWIVLSVYHSMVVYFVGYIMWQENNATLSSPYTVDLFGFGTFMIHMVVFVVNLKLWLIARYQTIVFLASILGSISVFVTSTLLHNFFYVWDGQMMYVYNHLIQSGAFWMSNLLIIIAALLPDYAIMAFKMFDIKFRPPNANGWSQVFKKPQKKVFRQNSGFNSISESTYL